MYNYCRECGEFFKEPNYRHEKELHTEVGAYEEWDVPTCPFCGSEDLEDAYTCECCGEPHSLDPYGLCKECEAELRNAVMDIASDMRSRNPAITYGTMVDILNIFLEKED